MRNPVTKRVLGHIRMLRELVGPDDLIDIDATQFTQEEA